MLNTNYRTKSSFRFRCCASLSITSSMQMFLSSWIYINASPVRRSSSWAQTRLRIFHSTRTPFRRTWCYWQCRCNTQ